MSDIFPVIVPKWGLSMEEGILVEWHIEEGDDIDINDEIIDIETSKVTNTLVSAYVGVLRRKTADLGKTYACGTLIAVIANETVTDTEIDAFIDGFTITSKNDQNPSYQEQHHPQTIIIKGKRLRYLKMGEARNKNDIPILFIHGFSGDLNNWLFVQPTLSASRATYAIDLPGHGESTKDLSDLAGFTDFANLLFDLLDNFGIEKVHIVAHSMGAAIALYMARKQSDKIASLSLLNPVGVGKPVNKEFIRGLISSKNRREVAGYLKMLFANEALVTRDMADDILKYKRLDGVETALSILARFLEQENRLTEDALKNIAQPINLIWGGEDKIIEPIEKIAFPHHATLKLLKDIGHMPHMENSTAVIELIEKCV